MTKVGVETLRVVAVFVILLSGLPAASYCQDGVAAGIDSLSFMAGCWAGDLGDGTRLRETYTSPQGGAMYGNSQVVAGGETQFFEFIRITEEADGVAYRPYPGSAESVAFPLVRLTATEAVFENPDHDYPQRVTYRAVGDDGLVARIEKIDGDQAQQFAMKAVPCGDERHRTALAKAGS